MTASNPPIPPRPPRRHRVPAQWQRRSTVEAVDGLPLVTLRLNAAGEVDPDDEALLLAELDAAEANDLLVLGHGWNLAAADTNPVARAFFQAVPPLLERYGRTTGRRRPVVLLDLEWPGHRWPDEPVPALDTAEEVTAPPPPDPVARQVIRSAFDPVHHTSVDEMLSLLIDRPDDPAALKRARALIRTLAEEAPDPGDGERRDVTSIVEIDDPYPDQLFADFALALTDLGIVTDPDGGRAGYGDSVARLWHGAQEAFRQLTYWQLKRRAGVVGERGLGSLLARLSVRRPGLGVNLIGHGLGARVVAYALRALPEDGSGVRSVTLLQGELSHFAFADKLPFDPSRSGVLGGLQGRVRGPLVACYSRFDTAAGVFAPLAARAAGPSAGIDFERTGWDQVAYRWGGLGHDGPQPSARELPLQPPGRAYDFTGPGLVGIDASRVVRRGRPPSGAHADICHPELAWIVLTAAGLC